MTDEHTDTDTEADESSEKQDTIEYVTELAGDMYNHQMYRQDIVDAGGTIKAERDPEETYLPGVGYPTLEAGCPECGGFFFNAQEASLHGVSFTVSDDGNPTDFSGKATDEARLVELECGDCGATLIENGEIVHDEMSAD